MIYSYGLIAIKLSHAAPILFSITTMGAATKKNYGPFSVKFSGIIPANEEGRRQF